MDTSGIEESGITGTMTPFCKHSLQRIVGALLLVVMLATAWQPSAVAQGAAVRVLAVDADTGTISVIDGLNGTVLATFDGPGGGFSAPFVTADGRYFITNFFEANATVVIDSGLHAEDHGDHQDLEIVDPALVTTFLSTGPAHYWAHGAETLIYSDGDGTVSVLDETSIAAGAEPTLFQAETDHATVASIGDTVILGYYTLGRVDLYDIGGQLISENVASCPATHGEAAVPTGVVLACADDLLLIEGTGAPEELIYTRIPYPDRGLDTPESTPVATPADAPSNRSNVLASSPRSDLLAGDFPGGILLVDPTTSATSIVELPATPRWLAYTSDGRFVLTIADNGTVYAINPTSGEIAWETPTTTPHAEAAPEDANALYPFIATAGEFAFVGDPGTGEIVALDVASGEITQRIAVGGRPARVAATIASGIQH
jgi:zinc transport system substrate-binding protein